ncbi:MAG: phosphate system positive regulatory protein pho81 [Phylliscum demangeonii]|nr:MAG: phosphate system positive regulatory protein pho81 [Phylliscum demangeonii]
MTAFVSRAFSSRIFTKFGKHLQKRQLDIPEYAASFVDYKALKKLIKRLSATPVISPQRLPSHSDAPDGPQAALQANKATFFFRLERELDKVNARYLRKEAELKLRLKTLLDKKRLMRAHSHPSKLSASFMALEEGFQQFGNDLNKLQQFIEVNATAFSKILKKWDKTSKVGRPRSMPGDSPIDSSQSRTKELYLSRAVEVQPCFNREVISELSDQATTSLLELGAWAEGEKVQLEGAPSDYVLVGPPLAADEADDDGQLLDAVNSGSITTSADWLSRLQSLPNASAQITRAFLAAIPEAPDAALRTLLQTNLVDIDAKDEINERNSLHEAAIYGRGSVLEAGLAQGLDVARVDVYGRIPLHYACMHGRIEMMEALIHANPGTIDEMDHDRFTPLIHAVVSGKLECVQKLLSYHARINPTEEADHIPLNLACQHGLEQIARLLLEQQAKVLADAEGLFPQHSVARSGRNPHLLLLLRQFGANLDEVDKLNQWTPLFHAASDGHVDCLRTLLENGARVDIVDEKDLSAMYYAAWEGHLECMRLLDAAGGSLGLTSSTMRTQRSTGLSTSGTIHAPASVSSDADGIPDLSLPPPFIPLRRYGHNFLDSKTFIQIQFEEHGSDPIVFYGGGKYPAARLTVSSKVCDLIPRNIPLPVQEDTESISFQIDHLDSFAIDFDIFPTFGAKLIARSVALSNVFSSTQTNAGHCSLPLFNPRLRAIGQIGFSFQVIKPFQGHSLEITDFATYWKATTPFDSQPTAAITDSSLSGAYVRLHVQLTSDFVPVLHRPGCVWSRGIAFPVSQLTYAQFVAIAHEHRNADDALQALAHIDPAHAGHASQLLADSMLSLRDALSHLPSGIHVDLHIVRLPSARPDAQVQGRGAGAGRFTAFSSPNLNFFADAILQEVFDHSRHLRQTTPDFMRSIVFSSYDADVCTALNWKQPNYPVFLCNDLGRQEGDRTASSAAIGARPTTAGWSLSIKEAVKTAQNNNLMGLICYSGLLDMVPALVESIRAAGLVLVTDTSRTATAMDVTSLAPASTSIAPNAAPHTTATPPAPGPHRAHSGIDGVLSENGILRFGPLMA